MGSLQDPRHYAWYFLADTVEREELIFSQVFYKKRSEKFHKIHRKTLLQELKMTPTKVFSYWFCQIFLNPFLRSTAGWLLLLNSLRSLRRPQPQSLTLDLCYFLMIICKHFQRTQGVTYITYIRSIFVLCLLVFSEKILWIAARRGFWKPQAVSCDWIDLVLINQAVRSKCCWKS